MPVVCGRLYDGTAMTTPRQIVFSGTRPSGQLHKGARRARTVAGETLAEVRDRMGVREAAF